MSFSYLGSPDCGHVLQFGAGLVAGHDQGRLLVRVELEGADVALVVESNLLGTRVFEQGDAFAAGGLGAFFNWKALLLAALIFVGLKKLKWSPIVFVAISAVGSSL